MLTPLLHLVYRGHLTISSRYSFAAPVVGSVAPDFTLPSNTGKDIALKDLLKKAKHTVLYFYPGQSRQACLLWTPPHHCILVAVGNFWHT